MVLLLNIASLIDVVSTCNSIPRVGTIINAIVNISSGDCGAV